MGRWSIHIEGEGPHHNRAGSNDDDADLIARTVVDSLVRHGHDLQVATFWSSEGPERITTLGGKVVPFRRPDPEAS